MSANGFMRRVPRNVGTTNHSTVSIKHDPYCREICSAPLNRVLTCRAADSIGDYLLPFPCIRTAKGWINARTGTPLHLQIAGWRY